MGGSKKAAAAPLLRKEHLESLVREAIRAASALRSSDIKKALPKPNRSQHAQALAIAQELVERGEIYRWANTAGEWFFASEPIAILEKVVPDVLAAGPLAADALQQRITLETKIPKACFAEWKNNALERGRLFAVSAVAGAPTKSGSKLLALEPDLRVLLKTAIGALQKGLKQLDARGIPREQIAAVLWEELGLSAAAPSFPRTTSVTTPERGGGHDRDAFLRALRVLASEHPSGTLLTVGDLRSRLALDKSRFDTTALSLSREGSIILHHHDYAEGLAADERSRLVQDANGTYYVGIAMKSN